MTKKILGPISRVEGDLEIELELEDQVVQGAKIKSTMYRGFEEMMPGKNIEDALVLTPRICGICSISQSVATSRALANSAQIEVATNGELVTKILHATEVVADLFTHFYLFYMPDFCHSSYQNQDWYRDTLKYFEPVKGQQYGLALKARARLLNIMGILGGRWPHTLAIQPGGTTKTVTLSEIIQIRNILAEFNTFLVNQVYGCSLEEMSEIDSISKLTTMTAESDQIRQSDFGRFLQLSQHNQLDKTGIHQGGYMSFGHSSDTRQNNSSGIRLPQTSQIQSLNTDLIIESVESSFYMGAGDHPSRSKHYPNTQKPAAYSWSKSPRYQGQAMEVGAISRAIMNSSPLAEDFLNSSGVSAHGRIVLRMQEMAQLLLQMDQWASQIQSSQPFINDTELPRDGEGTGLVEAARGSLGHWIKYRGNKIQHYQIIAPTTWNFSPRDSESVPGPLEQALIGINMETEPQKVQHVIRSFDPCMQCTVH